MGFNSGFKGLIFIYIWISNFKTKDSALSYSKTRPLVADGGTGFRHAGRVAANIQSRSANNEMFSSLGVRLGANNSSL